MYASLATKYRPRKFAQVIGQPDVPIVKAVVSDHDCLPPLLLFCGPSGVGKTTIARIIASALNCGNLSEAGEPCGTCGPCISIKDNTHPNVYEMDAASHGTAEKLRDLVVKSHLSSNGVKIFILDEAQSISGQGWNVLLKVLEEPPPNCMFMLLTSEARKVPAKIRTRALRFTFKPVPPAKLRWYVGQVAVHSSSSASEEDLDIISEMSDGSVRDALMMLEQCNASELTAQELFAEKDLSLEYLTAILDKDYIRTLELVDLWWGETGDAKTILSQLALSLEKLALTNGHVEHYNGPISSSKYQSLSSGLGTESIVGILTGVSEWFMQVYSKAQVVMLTSKLYKQVNGSDEQLVIPKKEAAPLAEKSAIDERISAL